MRDVGMLGCRGKECGGVGTWNHADRGTEGCKDKGMGATWTLGYVGHPGEGGGNAGTRGHGDMWDVGG